MTTVGILILYLFVGGICTAWWTRHNGILCGEDELVALAVLFWPVGLGFETAYRIGRIFMWAAARMFPEGGKR